MADAEGTADRLEREHYDAVKGQRASARKRAVEAIRGDLARLVELIRTALGD